MLAKKGHKAQTAVELAVFGAILIFALGTIIRAAVNRGNQQHSPLRAARMALTMSYRTSDSVEIASRNTASVLIVEDRLTADSGKYGAIDRVPIITQGSGTHSANLFMPVDFPDVEDLPVFDLLINGKHFPFTTAGFKRVHFQPIQPTAAKPNPPCPGQCLIERWVNKSDPPIETCRPCEELTEFEPNCIKQTVTRRCRNRPDLCSGANPPCSDCDVFSTETFVAAENFVGCPKLYTSIDNDLNIKEWCDGTIRRPCPDACSAQTPPGPPGCNLSADERFDLDRDGTSDVSSAHRAKFSRQWFLVMGFDERANIGVNRSLINGYAAGDLADFELQLAEGVNIDRGKNTLLDVDGDLMLEQVLKISSVNGIIRSVSVRDSQEGDIDFGSEDESALPPGLLDDATLFSFVHDSGPDGGTYLQIDEGKLFSGSDPDKQFIRTASRKDTLDIVERFFQLSSNTHRFCAPDGFRQLTIAGIPKSRGGVDNPVEVCVPLAGECFSPQNRTKTCLDLTNSLLIIRSRITDVHGRKWVTDTSDDPHVEFDR